MNTTDGMWVPSYYRQQHPVVLWVRDAGRPQVVDWLTGAAVAVLVLGLVALVRAPHHEALPSAAVVATITTQNSDTNADRVAYVAQPASVDK